MHPGQSASSAPSTPDTEEHDLLETLRRVTLGEYDVYSLLGQGGMASVYLALDLSLNRPVAIKVINPSALTRKQLVERFRLEARTAASLSHPHVIPIYAVRSQGGLHYFVMKHVEGGSLDMFLKRDGKLSLSLARTILCQAASALAYAHRRGVVHRDVKPGNIMLDDEGYTVVMDFGIAKVKDADELTASGMTLGTPFYMSPEQFSTGPLDGRSDQYSLGVLAFELLTGHRPFKGDSMPEVLRGHLLEVPPDVRELRRDCPEVLAQAIKRMLAKSPDDRFPRLEMLVGELETLPSTDVTETRNQISSIAKAMSLSQPRISQPVTPLPAGQALLHADKPARAPLTGHGRERGINRWLLAGGVAAAAIITTATVLAAKRQSVKPELNQTIQYITPAAPVDSTAPSGTGGALANEVVPPSPPAAQPAATEEKRSPPAAEKKATAKRSPAADRKSAEATTAPVVTPRDTTPAPVASLAIPVPDPVPASPPVIRDGVIRIGSRVPRAGLYVDGNFAGLIGAIRAVTHKPGQVRLQIKAEDCASWDTVLYLAPGDTSQIAYRNPRCSR